MEENNYMSEEDYKDLLHKFAEALFASNFDEARALALITTCVKRDNAYGDKLRAWAIEAIQIMHEMEELLARMLRESGDMGDHKAFGHEQVQENWEQQFPGYAFYHTSPLTVEEAVKELNSWDLDELLKED